MKQRGLYINATKERTAHRHRYNVNYCKIVRDTEHILNIIFVMEIVLVDQTRLLETELINRLIRERINRDYWTRT